MFSFVPNRFSIKQKITILSGLALLSFGTVNGLLNWNVQKLNQVIQSAAQVNQTSSSLQDLLSEMQDSETGQRGYLITGQPAYLEPYYRGVSSIGQRLQKTRSLLQNNPIQIQRLDAVERLITWKLAELSQTIQQRQNQGFDTALQTVKTNRGQADMDEIRALILVMRTETQQLLQQQEMQTQTQTQMVMIISGASGLLTLLLGFVGVVAIRRDLDRRFRLEAQLQDTQALFDAFMNNSPAVAYVKDEVGRYVYMNRVLEDLFNIKFTDLKGKTDHDWLPLETVKQVQANDRMVLATQQMTSIVETVSISDTTQNHWLSFKFPVTDSAGKRFVGGISLEITARVQLEKALFKEKELLQVTLNSIGDGVVTTDAAGQVQLLNPVAEGLTGWSHQAAQGQSSTEVLNMVNETTRKLVQSPIDEALQTGQVVELANHTILIARDGNETPISDSAAPIRTKDGEILGAVMVFRDVSHTHYLNQQLSWQASHDTLTNLFNRREFERRLTQLVEIEKQDGQSHALCYLDLDQFKIVNDTCGHFAGDQLLRQVTDLLKKHIRKADTLARLGGDEFGLLLDHCPAEQAEQIANLLCEEVKAIRFVWEDKMFTIGVSIGLVVITSETESVASLLSMADAACYAAKNAGRNRVHVYRANDEKLAQQQGEMQWVGRLNQALEDDRFCLYYQPIVPLKQPRKSTGEYATGEYATGEYATGEYYEVLLRLKDELGQIVLPMAFIPAAERYNLMPRIDRWVIRTLFASQRSHYQDVWMRYGAEAGASHLYAINLSGASLNDADFVNFLHEQFALHQIPPQLICFEITETVAITNLTQAAQFINEMKELGCRFALDDFGSGMSSFSYLKNLPVDFLKIDGSFVKTLMDDPVSLVIVEAIKDIGQAIGLKTIAESVENDAVFDKLASMGIDYAQGYGVMTPCPLF